MLPDPQTAPLPDLTAMVLLDVTMIVLASLTTAIACRYWVFLAGAQARVGVFLILGSFWALASVYIADLITMTVLPPLTSDPGALMQIRLVIKEHGWYVQVGTAGLLCLGLWSTCRRLARQHERVSAARGEAERQSRHKTNFLASMSHELRTPLNAVIGYAQLMQLPGAARDEERHREYAGHIQSSGEMLLAMIDDLLDLSRIEAGRLALNFESVDTAELVRACVNGLEPLATSGQISISVHASAAMPRARADTRAIEQITLNLMSNAIKHTPPGGHIDVVLDVSADGDPRFFVSDNGPGIPRDLLPDIFEPYVHGDPMMPDSGRSHGLGLAICKRLVDAHGGTIEARSAPGEGASFSVTLPRAPDAPTGASAAA